MAAEARTTDETRHHGTTDAGGVAAPGDGSGQPGQLRRLERRFDGRMGDRLREAATPGLEGACAALDSFYYALNQRDLGVLRQVWSGHPLAQLNNPLGGIVRGGDAIVELYRRILSGEARLAIALEDVVLYPGADHAVFAGRERGSFTAPDGTLISLEIRTSRYLRFDARDGWRQAHHHGSIDDADLLRDYQAAVARAR